jgi:hypothetical protein
MFFEQNAQALLQADKIHAPLVARLRETAPTEDYQVYETGDGYCTLRYRDVYLHSAESPLKEVAQVLATQCTPGHDRLHVILGLGMGYLLDEVFRASAGHIVVYEPDLPLLRFVLDNVNLTALLGSGRIWLVDTQVDLLGQIRRDLYRQYQLDMMVLRGHAHLLAGEIPTLMAHITELEMDRIYDAKTGRAFHFQWLNQFLGNLPEFANLDTLDDLYGRYQGKPALVISRGPSLDAALNDIRELSGSTVLIAVGGAVRRLWEAGIIPDFAVFYDANGLQEQLHGIPAEVLAQITFLISPFAQRCIFEAPAREKRLFLGQNNAQLADWLDAALGRKHQRLDGGGTVSIIGFQAALAMGCNPVTLVGQDLAFPNNQAYAGGITVQQDAEGRLALTPSETLYAEPETMATTLGQNGETLPTLKAYTSFIRHLEELAHKNAQNEHPVSLYNASIGGAHLEGFTLRALADLTSEFPTTWKQVAELHGVSYYSLPFSKGLTAPQSEERRLALQKGLLNLKAELQEASALMEQLSAALQNPNLPPQQGLTLIQTTNRQLNDFIGQHPFVGYWLMFEMIDFREGISRMTSTTEFIQQGFPALLNMLNNSQDIIRQKALPWVEQAYQALALQQHAQQSQTVTLA